MNHVHNINASKRAYFNEGIREMKPVESSISKKKGKTTSRKYTTNPDKEILQKNEVNKFDNETKKKAKDSRSGSKGFQEKNYLCQNLGDV